MNGPLLDGAAVDDAATANAMAEIIGVHASEATGGQTYAEMGRFLATDGGATSDEELAPRTTKGTLSPTRCVTSHSRPRPCG